MEDEAVFLCVMKHGPLTVRAIADAVGRAAGDVEQIVARLIARRLLYQHGENGAGELLYHWTPAPARE